MRTLTGQQTDILGNPYRVAHAKLEVDRTGSGAWVDMSDYEGHDWMLGVRWGDKVDSHCRELTATLHRAVGRKTLATLVDSSKLNQGGTLIDIGRKVKLSTATVGPDVDPVDTPVGARGTITLTGAGPNAAETFQLNGPPPVGEFTATVAGGDPSNNEFDIGATNAETCVNIAEALNQGDQSNNCYAWVDGDTVVVEWDSTETGGNSIVFTEALTNATMDGGGTLGGTRVGIDSTYVEVFRGEIDEVDWSKPEIQVRCRDEGGALADKFIETISKRPSAAAQDDVQDIMQEILTAEIGGVTLYSENGTAGTPFNAGDSPSWVVTKYFQSKQHLLEALRTLANMIGWDVKYGWQQNADSYELIMKEPPRAVRAQGTLAFTGLPVNNETFVINATTCTAKAAGPAGDQFLIGADAAETATNVAIMLNAETESANLYAWADGDDVIIEWNTPGTGGDAIVFTEALTNAIADGGGTLGGTRAGVGSTSLWTFAAADYGEFTRAKLTRRDIRNRVRVVFNDAAQDKLHTSVVRNDPASQAKYGLRACEFNENASKGIDRIAEANKMATAALDDLKDSKLLGTVPMPYFWPVEAGDLYTFAANDVHFDTAQSLAVVGYDHEISGKGSSTQLQLRGEPAGGYKRWLGIEARQGMAAAASLRNPDAADNPAIFSSMGGITVTYDDPRSMSPSIDDWAYTECYVSDTTPFTPSSATLKAKGKTTRFEIDDLIPGTVYYVKLKIINTDGDVGFESAQETTATQRVGPYHENNDAQLDQLLRNPDFNIFTQDETSNPPDFWDLISGFTWGSAADVYFDTTNQETGDKAIKIPITDASEPGLVSNYIPVRGGELISAHILHKSTVSDGFIHTQVRIRKYSDGYGVTQIGFSSQNFFPGVNYQIQNTGTSILAANVRSIRIEFVAIKGAGANHTQYIDRLGLRRSLAVVSRNGSTVLTVANVELTIDVDAADSSDIGTSYNAGLNEVTIDYPGVYQFFLNFLTTKAIGSVLHQSEAAIQLDTGGGFADVVRLGRDSRLTPGGPHVAEIVLMTPALEMAEGDIIRCRGVSDMAAAVAAQELTAQQIVRAD